MNTRQHTLLMLLGTAAVFVLAFWLIGGAKAESSCWFACGVRHPITWHDNHCESWRCRARRHHHSTPSYYHKHQLYPCVHRWTYHGRLYWHLHYLGGRKGRTHLGYGKGRRCL